MCGHCGSVQIAVPTTRPRQSVRTSTIGHHLLASRLAGDGAHREIERGKLGPDHIGGVVVASAASHVRGLHAQISEQNKKRKAACFPPPNVRSDNIFYLTRFVSSTSKRAYEYHAPVISSSLHVHTAIPSTRAFIHSRCCKCYHCTAVHGGWLGGWVSSG